MVKNTEKWCPIFFPNKMVVKDRHTLGKNRPLSNFHQIMLLVVNNEHASESKCTYFLEGEKRKYVNHEI